MDEGHALYLRAIEARREKRYDESEELFHQSSNEGHARAAFELGMLSLIRNRVGGEWFRMALARGYDAAALYSQPYEQIMERIFHVSAEDEPFYAALKMELGNGDAVAQLTLLRAVPDLETNGPALLLMATSYLSIQEVGASLTWARKAADLGYARAQLHLADRLEPFGHLAEAAYWLEQVEAQGVDYIAERLACIHFALGDPLRGARALFRNWMSPYGDRMMRFWRMTRFWRRAAPLHKLGANVVPTAMRLRELYVYGDFFHRNKRVAEREVIAGFEIHNRIVAVQRLRDDSHRRARAATIVWLGCARTLIRSPDMVRLIAHRIWASRVDPSAWNVEYALDKKEISA